TIFQDKVDADHKEEEKKKKLDELMRLILVGGEHKKEPFLNKKSRRMTWAPGRASASLYSPISIPPAMIRSKEDEQIEEEEETSNNDSEGKILSIDSACTEVTNDTWEEIKHHGVKTVEIIMIHVGVNTDDLENETMTTMNEKMKKMEEAKKEIENERNELEIKSLEDMENRMRSCQMEEERLLEERRRMDEEKARLKLKEDALTAKEEMIEKKERKIIHEKIMVEGRVRNISRINRYCLSYLCKMQKP
ncbi:hypothetical protein PENTCL1PPCAC_17932, partial [Pristionchus entomophagus]